MNKCDDKTHNVRGLLVFILLGGLCLFIALLLLGFVKDIEGGLRDLMMMVLGGWVTMTTVAVQFFFGSSSGSKTKSEQIDSLTSNPKIPEMQTYEGIPTNKVDVSVR